MTQRRKEMCLVLALSFGAIACCVLSGCESPQPELRPIHITWEDEAVTSVVGQVTEQHKARIAALEAEVESLRSGGLVTHTGGH